MPQFHFFTAKEIKAEGWMRRQLEIQAAGLSGNLDRIWPDVRDSAWIGGDREGWERVPYWLDGFIPLAYLLEDEDMIARAKKYVYAILSRQRPDGWICPCAEEAIPNYDTWAVLLISKVLTVYYECSGDESIPGVIYRTMKNYYELLAAGKIRLFHWGKFRWFEGFVALNFLKERYDEPWIGELAELLCEQGQDYGELTELWKRPLNQWTFETHVVNLAMMLKTEAVTKKLLPERFRGQAERLYSMLMQYNGTAVDAFTGDECLAGVSPIQGTELCAVAELMYSFELLYAATGEPAWAQRLELVAFNALPATLSDDMWTHQYLQMVNQISCERFPGKPIFRTNGPESHLFGLEPNYGCCTANFNQAFPKFVLSAFLYHDDTVLSAIPIPSSLHTDGISIRLTTDYPFRNAMTYSVRPGKAFRLAVRVPSFAENLTVNGKTVNHTGMLFFDIEADQEYEIKISFACATMLMDRPDGMKTVSRGSLVFALPISAEKRKLEYERDGVERKFPYCDYEYIGMSEWRYGLNGEPVSVNEKPITKTPFSSQEPPITVTVPVRRIDWAFEDGYNNVAAKRPGDPAPIGEEELLEFYPYGCAKLRMTELPLCKND